MSPDIPDAFRALGGRHADEVGTGRQFALPPVLVPLGLLLVPLGAVLGLLVTAWLWLVALVGVGLAAAVLLGSAVRWLGIDADTLYVVGRVGGATQLLAAVPRTTITLRAPMATWVALDAGGRRVWVPATVARALVENQGSVTGGSPASPPAAPQGAPSAAPSPAPAVAHKPLGSPQPSDGIAVSLRRSRAGIAGGIIGATVLLVWLASGWP